ncbi:MAG: ImmA/IrrE family metallo-endopeptidase [Bacteroidetes bacterium]|nr:ImmA/IrrE family metallo-endopeptidase [Bacteroidota bacterium]
MITALRKTNLHKLAAFIAEDFTSQNITQLEKIAESEDISVYYDHYENNFDGMLVCDEENNFHIHLNIDRGNTPDSPRGRFSFSHELAHYFIEEHRIPLLKGEAAPHGSLHDFEHRGLVEDEADYFAGCLLMPEKLFRKVPTGKKFSLDTILTLSGAFHTSVLATVLRFVEIGTHEICVVVSEKNIAKWFAKNSEFPDWAFRFKVHQALPPSTVAGEFFSKPDAKYTGVEDVEPENWFYPRWQPKTQMHEQCYFSDSYGYVISLIWFD